MLVAALLRGLGVPGDGRQFLFDLLPVDIVEMHLSFREDGHLHVADVIDVARVLEDRGHVGGDVGPVRSLSHDQRAVLPRAVQAVRFIFEEDAEGVGSPDPEHRPGNGLQRVVVPAVVVVHQLDRGLRVRLGMEAVARAHQLVLQLLVIFNDAVVHQRDLPVVRGVGMRVHLRRLPVGRPAGVADAASALHRAALVRLLHK